METLELTELRVLRGGPLPPSMAITNGDDCASLPVEACKGYRFSFMNAAARHVNMCGAAATEIQLLVSRPVEHASDVWTAERSIRRRLERSGR